MWCLETLEAINAETYRRATNNESEHDALFAVIDRRFKNEEEIKKQPKKVVLSWKSPTYGGFYDEI